ncbi:MULTISPECIES: SOS-induced cell division inhibitor SulA [Brenneria]|uniref:Cell division inhibitor SulA n=1 Tax=Brenneria nigrifluens DSM 30175 = ATCC 13028 TaxID=1121120 RepID=A0A2U1UK01_9GAMM|nr:MULTISPECIES: SOS-induced cell division inhibitor SulA [Brenneria]EHD20992.1 Cell division inhibitor sulA [Brenneria sp. EniD312]PWC22009.1 cell division inhibitor SulA [Brenneria nigrifluens DSM 30175 = ATCC 13028]QCR04149.1 cell division inhibitor SulA [Brenneria nigrifluens DSM 30175 = ATCC 13028]
MRTQSLNSYNDQSSPFSANQSATASSLSGGGMISEIVYNADQPIVTYILLPLLQQLGAQSRWLLWLSPQQKLSRPWLQQSGLPLDKIVQLNHINPLLTVDAMEKALLTGNYSAVLCWLPDDLTEKEKVRLRQAALSGNSYGFIMRPENTNFGPYRLLPSLKIHSTLYH